MYYHNENIVQNLQQIYDYLNAQHERMIQLETTIQDLQNQIHTLEQNQTSTPDKIVYKFDQLKVEKLEGTLNIGITPNHGEHSIEDFTVHQNDLNVSPVHQQHPMIFETVQQHIQKYLNGECYKFFDTIEKQNDYRLDGHHRQYIVEDIRKQIDNRIRYYLNQINLNDLSEEDLVEVEAMTINKVKEDIHKTYAEFIQHLPRKE